MNIVYLHRTQGMGVEAVHITGMIKAFRKLGHTVTVISPRNNQFDGREDGNAVSEGSGRSLLSWLSSALPEVAFEIIEILYNLVVAVFLIRMVAGRGCDLIYERYSIYSFIGVIFSKITGRPIILEVNYTAKVELVRKRSSLLQPLAVWIDGFVFRNAHSCAVVSSYLKEHLKKEYRVPAERIIVVPNAANPEEFSVHKEVIANQIKYRERVIGFVGGFYPWHGLNLLVEAYSSIADDIPGIKLLLIGDGPEKALIEKKVSESGISEVVHFTGMIEHHNLPKYIQSFTVGVMPDSNTYGSPMKIFEYMAMGIPVVVPDYGPLLDVVKNGQQGLIFRKKDSSSLALVLKYAFQNERLLLEMSKNARKTVERERNWLVNAKRNLEFLRTTHEIREI